MPADDSTRPPLTLLGGRALFVATAQAFHDEMARRIAAHRAERPSAWPASRCRSNAAHAEAA